MAESVQAGEGGLIQAMKVAEQCALATAANGVRYAAYGDNSLSEAELKRIVEAVPVTISAALKDKGYYFVPLALNDKTMDKLLDTEAVTDGAIDDRRALSKSSETMIALAASPELTEQAICHRNVRLTDVANGGAESTNAVSEGVFISTRLLGDRFALAFEFFINVGHAFVDAVGVPEKFSECAWKQVLADVRGETSQDAWEHRRASVAAVQQGTSMRIDEKAKSAFLEAAFADAVAIYQLSLAVDFDYAELREREYPLLAPQALAERLRLVAALFPANAGYEFSIRYRRKS